MTEEQTEDLLTSDNNAGKVELEALQKALDAAEGKVKENWDLYLRARADLENLRKRAQLDVENAHKYGMERFARELLLVLDSMEQGIWHVKDKQDVDVKVMQDGMELTLKLFLDVLDKFTVKEIVPAIGSMLDPVMHEVISAQDKGDVPTNTILAVVQRGFLIQNRVLRPARVVVARNVAPASADTTTKLE